MKLFLILTFLSSLGSSFAGPLSPECRQFIASLPRQFISGFLEVPENQNDQGSRKIKIFYYAGNLESAGDPIIFFNGGPGFSSHSLAGVWAGLLGKMTSPFVTLDQRGTGCSEDYPIATNSEAFDRLQYYGSRGIVGDAEALRKKLFGQRKWKVFGQSYGGFIVHRYMTLFPESLSSAHAHGLALTRNPLGDYFFRVVSQHRISEKFLATYPEDRSKIFRVHRAIKDADCFTKNQFQVCGRGAWDGVLAIGIGSNQYERLRKNLDDLVLTNGTLNRPMFTRILEETIYPIYARPQNTRTSNVLATGESYIAQMEIIEGTMDPSDPSKCLEINRWISRSVDLESMAVNECRFVLSMRTPNQNKDSSLLPEVKKDFLTLDFFLTSRFANPRIPFYLYSGALDTLVPQEMFVEEVSELGTLVKYKNFPNSGHEGFLTEPLVLENLRK